MYRCNFWWNVCLWRIGQDDYLLGHLMKMDAIFLKRAPEHLGQFSLSMIFSRKGGL
jgi:hypothetical protein